MISTHVLDLNSGKPAVDVEVCLEVEQNGQWRVLKNDKTNADGRIQFACDVIAAKHRLTFDIDSYLSRSGLEPFFVSAPIVFKIKDVGRNYHIPLLLSSFGFSTYRGS